MSPGRVQTKVFLIRTGWAGLVFSNDADKNPEVSSLGLTISRRLEVRCHLDYLKTFELLDCFLRRGSWVYWVPGESKRRIGPRPEFGNVVWNLSWRGLLFWE